MNSFSLDVDNSIDSHFFDFVVFSVKEVQNRVANAEHNSNFTSHEEFWSDIDRKVQNFQSLS